MSFTYDLIHCFTGLLTMRTACVKAFPAMTLLNQTELYITGILHHHKREPSIFFRDHYIDDNQICIVFIYTYMYFI